VTRSHASGTWTSTEAAVRNRELSERVRAALHADPYLYDRHVEVTVEGKRRGAQWICVQCLGVAGRSSNRPEGRR
jgi:hypothetical protein